MEKKMVDQAIQVNFPIVTKRMHHYNTSNDLYSQNRGNSWNYLSRPSISRPKSLNFPPIEPVLGRKIIFPDSQDLPLGTLTVSPALPPFSSSSSNSSSRKPPRIQDEDYVVISDNCECCKAKLKRNNNLTENNKILASQDLSWRNLHMSRAKLKATATTSELLSGFAMVAMVELQINEPTNVPEWLFITFAICTTVLVSVHIFALMISTYILPNIDAIAKLDICELVKDSPHERMRNFIQLAWAFSTVLGLFLFLIELTILCWVKFWDYSFNAAIAATIVVIPVLAVFILFVVHFYHSLVVYKCNSSVGDMEKLENMKRQLDEVTSPV